MIVRGSVLSDKRVTLESAPPERPAVAPIRAVPSVLHEEPLVRDLAGGALSASALTAVPGSGPAAALVAVSAPPPAPAPPPISFEAVAKWLATQNEASRTRLAGLLAGDIERIRSDAREEGWQEGP